MQFIVYLLFLLIAPDYQAVSEPAIPTYHPPTQSQLECASIVLHTVPLSDNITDNYKMQRAIQENGGSRTVALEDGTTCKL